MQHLHRINLLFVYREELVVGENFKSLKNYAHCTAIIFIPQAEDRETEASIATIEVHVHILVFCSTQESGFSG